MVYIYNKNTKLKELLNINICYYIFKIKEIPSNLKKLKIEDKHIEYYRHKYVSLETKSEIEFSISIKDPSYNYSFIGIFEAFMLITDSDKNKFIVKFLDSNEKGQRFSLRKFKSKIY